MSQRDPILPPPGSKVRVYYNGRYYPGTVAVRGQKRCRVEFALKRGDTLSRLAFVYPKDTPNLSATNWGEGGLTAFLVEAAPEPDPPPQPPPDPTPTFFGD